MEASELVNKIKNKKTLDDEWFSIYDEIVKFLGETHSEEDKRLFYPFGYLEVVSMMCDALKNKK